MTSSMAVCSFLFAVLCSIAVRNVSADNNNKLIVIMIDGFRYNYFDDPTLHLKGFPRMVKTGVRAQYLNPVYPSLTYPNILSFATGLYPEHHGFYGNMIWDNETDTFFEMLPRGNSSDPIWWQDAEPIWITAEKNNRRTAMYQMMGCEVKIHGVQVQICERHTYMPPVDEVKRDMMQRVNDIVEMFKPSVLLPFERLDLAFLYYSGIDWAGHYNGEDSPEFKKAVYDIDSIIDYTMHAISKAKLQNKVNLIVMSDHGMADVRNSTFISLEKYDSLIRQQVNSGPFLSLVAKEGKEDELYKALKAEKIKGLTVYRKDDIPEKYHLKNAKRFGPIVLECDQGYFVMPLRDLSKRIGDIALFDYYGEHGYAPKGHDDMRAVFAATGPDFRSGLRSKPLEMIDLYNVLCHILRIDPLPNNGTWSNVEPILRTLADGPYFSHAVSLFAHYYYFCIMCIVTITTVFYVLNYNIL